MKKLWEVWDYRTAPKLVTVVRGRKEAVDKAKQLAPSALHWHHTHKVFPAKQGVAMPRRRVRNRGLLDHPLRKVVGRWSTGGGNLGTNPPRTVFTLACGHQAEFPGEFVRRTTCRCEECPRNTK